MRDKSETVYINRQGTLSHLSCHCSTIPIFSLVLKSPKHFFIRFLGHKPPSMAPRPAPFLVMDPIIVRAAGQNHSLRKQFYSRPFLGSSRSLEHRSSIKGSSKFFLIFYPS
ncbi:Uncharacterized protein TCM_002186 [Theobroma cacao]|uniref:Uncharacterized protein n=1 Tax=Theobroma cacao TaxID=3641 RepID=A0A061DKN4_THECC|nr:Uncharacterized protein TCM_002186 [Theobroma cacao]